MTPEEEKPTALTDDADDQRAPYIIALNGPEVGAVFRVAQLETIVGAGSSADIRLTHPTVSRRHARLTLKRDGTVWIEDVGSTNGTFLGIDSVRKPTVVPDGANVGVGTFVVVRLSYLPLGSAAPSQFAHTRARLNSRSYLLGLLSKEHAYARRHGTPLTLVLVRADAVSSVSLARAVVCDEAMGVLGTEIDAAIRTEDFLAVSCRDEFAILVRCSGDDAHRMAERVRAQVESTACVRGSAFAFHTVTAVVVPLWTLPARLTPKMGPRPTADDLLSTARKVAELTFASHTNAVVSVPALVI